MSISNEHARKFGEIIVEQNVYLRCINDNDNKNRIQWIDLGLCYVKGKKETIHIYRPKLKMYNIQIIKQNINNNNIININKSLFVEIKQIYNKIDNFLNNNNNNLKNGKIIFIEGVIGIGKSSMLKEIQLKYNKKFFFLCFVVFFLFN